MSAPRPPHRLLASWAEPLLNASNLLEVRLPVRALGALQTSGARLASRRVLVDAMRARFAVLEAGQQVAGLHALHC